jgi:hypothetical protein
MQKSQLVYGSDPEFFAGQEIKGKTYVVPPAWFRVYGKVPYAPDIKHPVFLDALKEHGVLIMEDGAAFEETVIPSTDWKELFERINFGKKLLSEYILSRFPKDCLPEVQTIPTINYEVKRWMNESIEFQMCLIFGCDQDFDAWKRNAPGKVIDALKHKFRYGGGHIHISGSPAFKLDPILAIQCQTLSSGLAAVAFSDTPELDKSRTYLYGRPGKYRPQEYKGLFNNIPDTDFGIEYRTISNRWTNSLEHAGQIFKWAEIGVRNLLEEGLGLELIPTIGKEACDALVNCDQNKALELLAFVESKI